MGESGRPSDYTDDIAAHICAEIGSGRSLRSVCRDEGMPSDRTVFRWLASNEAFCQQYARAMEARTNALAEDILEIADDNSSDVRETEDGRELVNTDVIARAKLRVDTRKWLMSKMAPKKYGEKIVNEMTGKDGAAIKHEIEADAAFAKLTAALEGAAARKAGSPSEAK